ncbi:MAG: ribonuclease H-like domain-containing protein [Chloroflexi bacterium]|nr:ribonuclease H-like domain-containing protein [Chloroflexota bacterium]
MSGARAYLDIEMTFEWSITVVGIYRHDCGTLQFCGPAVTDVAIYDALAGVGTVVTFNGAGFDLLWLRRRLAIDLTTDFAHDDLMVRCRRRGVRGGLKQIEQQFGITRRSTGLTGRDAPRLWHEYDTNGDEQALAALLEYNREDVVNLALLEHRLDDAPAPDIHPAVQVWR